MQQADVHGLPTTTPPPFLPSTVFTQPPYLSHTHTMTYSSPKLVHMCFMAHLQ